MRRGCVFYFESVSVVFFQIFLRLPICTKTDSECTAHRDLFHVSRKYFCFPKKAPAAAIFNYLNKIFGKHTRGKKTTIRNQKKLNQVCLTFRDACGEFGLDQYLFSCDHFVINIFDQIRSLGYLWDVFAISLRYLCDIFAIS